MKTSIKILSILAIAFGLTIVSCKKDPNDPPTQEYGTVTISIENMVGDSALVFNTKNYVNQNGDTFNVSIFKYYISNIKLIGNSETYIEPESYHLVDHSVSSSMEFTLNNVPVGDYTSMTFLIGIDSTRNVSGAQTGALDPGNGMFWSWSTGYIMAKLEGTSPQSPELGNAITYHIGGFSGANNSIQSASPSLGGATIQVTSTTTPEIHMRTDVLEWFKTPTTISFASSPKTTMPNSLAKSISDNYADMISVEEVHN